MTTLELEAQKAMLAREILSIDNMETIMLMKKSLAHILAKVRKEEHTPYSIEEITGWVDEAEQEIAAGIPGISHEQLCKKMEEKYPWLCR